MNTEIKDTEIRIIGGEEGGKKGRHGRGWWKWVLVALVAIGVLAMLLLNGRKRSVAEEPTDTVAKTMEVAGWVDEKVPTDAVGVVVFDTVVDSVPLQIYFPCNTVAELFVGEVDTTSTDIVLAALAADIRRDNGKIVGAYVLHGEPLSWGLSKQGYCAIIDGEVIVGVAENSPLFEQATEAGGDFFRQYPAVSNGVAQSNAPENASLRRALCMLDGRTCIVCSRERMLMNDFATTLAHLGVSEAIFLVGGQADGWWRDSGGQRHCWSQKEPLKHRNMNYILFRQP